MKTLTRLSIIVMTILASAMASASMSAIPGMLAGASRNSSVASTVIPQAKLMAMAPKAVRDILSAGPRALLAQGDEYLTRGTALRAFPGLSDTTLGSWEIGCGILRPTSTGTWGFITGDGGHQVLGGASVSLSGGNVVLTFNKTYNRVGTFLAVPDETFASLGYTMGSSVSQSAATITIRAGAVFGYLVGDGTSNSNAFTITAPTTGYSVAYTQATGAITITHPIAGTGVGISAISRLTDGAFSTIGRLNSFAFGGSPSATTTTLYLVDPATGLVRTGATSTLDRFSFTRQGGVVDAATVPSGLWNIWCIWLHRKTSAFHVQPDGTWNVDAGVKIPSSVSTPSLRAYVS